MFVSLFLFFMQTMNLFHVLGFQSIFSNSINAEKSLFRDRIFNVFIFAIHQIKLIIDRFAIDYITWGSQSYSNKKFNNLEWWPKCLSMQLCWYDFTNGKSHNVLVITIFLTCYFQVFITKSEGITFIEIQQHRFIEKIYLVFIQTII